MKLWGGRFSKATDGLVDDFHSSISFDQRLAEQDITGSIAHATMLGEQGIIPQADADLCAFCLRGARCWSAMPQGDATTRRRFWPVSVAASSLS